MSIALGSIVLDDRFTRELKELAVPWTARDVPDPQVLAVNGSLAAELGLDPGWLRGGDGARFLVGNLLPEGVSSVAQAYAGNQFGGPLARLGDGRALLLGEIVDQAGGRRDVHLKGSGRIDFARIAGLARPRG